jgi:predicted secreted protein
MAFLSGFAVYFIIWWLTLFIILPIGLRTQEDEGVVVPGTVESAPARFRGGRVLLATTLVAGLIYGAWHFASAYLGFSLGSLPNIVPDFGRN